MFRSSRSTPERKKKEFESPMDELNHLLDTLEDLIQQSMNEYIELIRPPPPESKPRRSSVLDSLKKLKRRANGSTTGEDDANPPNNPEKTAIPPPNSPTSESTSRPLTSFFRRDVQQDARFVPMTVERVAEFVETIRRVAELVIIGERSQSKSDTDEYMAVFETFFERQGLAMITNILVGASFDLPTHPTIIQEQKEETIMAIITTEEDAPRLIPLEDHQYKLLPPIAIATQAIQSVSILVQNVSRATSLFFILSNNHVNELINFPLDLYNTAERRNHDVATGRRFASQEIAELTTHFVTFLKSLAMRMNAETLQFFLTYPAGMPTDEVEDIIVMDTHASGDDDETLTIDDQDEPNDEDRPMDEIAAIAKPATSTDLSSRPISIKTVKVEFPLYERALDFCSAHHDSFVRVTAMNICLNTLRIATVTPSGHEEQGESDVDLGKSPDGVLHNAKPLPLKERVAIAQYVCTPARVERLASPIFTKLAQLWGVLEEQFREMDTTSPPTKAEDAESKLSSGKVARAKEKARREKTAGAFNDTAYNFQDELLLLEDVLKVGLTSLNEQMIEMMFATFVYPLLLQPLLLYFQRSSIPNEVLFADPLNEHSAGRSITDSDLTATEKAIISAPAKSAFFCLTAAFQFLTNPPLLRLLFTALFHPLAPDATGETMIRAKADVACLDGNGKVEIRIDTPETVVGQMSNTTDRSTYLFGAITGQKCVSSSASRNISKSETSCVFVLAPALAEILEFRGHDAALIARTRQNPYRKAIFQCFSLCSQLSDLRPLAVLAVETAVSKFSARFLSDILFGMDLQRFKAALPMDERESNSIISRVDDRDIGGGTIAGHSRLSLGDSGTGMVGFDYKHEILSAFRSCIMRATPAGKGTWKLEYDMIAARSLLYIIRGNPAAILDAAKRIDKRCRQAAAFLSDIPHSVERFSSSMLSGLLLGLENHTPRDSAKIEAIITNILFHGALNVTETSCVLNDLFAFKSFYQADSNPVYAVPVTETSSYSEMCVRCCTFPPMDLDLAEGALRAGMGSARAWAQLGTFHEPCTANTSSL